MDRLERNFLYVAIAYFIWKRRECFISDIESHFKINSKTLYYQLKVWEREGYIQRKSLKNSNQLIILYIIKPTDKLTGLVNKFCRRINIY